MDILRKSRRLRRRPSTKLLDRISYKMVLCRLRQFHLHKILVPFQVYYIQVAVSNAETRNYKNNQSCGTVETIEFAALNASGFTYLKKKIIPSRSIELKKLKERNNIFQTQQRSHYFLIHEFNFQVRLIICFLLSKQIEIQVWTYLSFLQTFYEIFLIKYTCE